MSAPTVPTTGTLPGLTLCQDINTALEQLYGATFVNLVSITTTTTLTASYLGNVIVSAGTGAIVLTLPLTSACVAGGTIRIIAGGSHSTTVNRQGSDVMVPNSVTNINTIVMGAGDYIDFTSNNSGAWEICGTGTFPLSTVQALYARLASPALTGTPTAPTPAFLDDSTNIATTAFVRQQGVQFSGYGGFNSNTTLTTADLGTFIVVYGTCTGTLPDVSTCPVGTVIGFIQTTGVGTIVTNGSDEILVNGGGEVASFTLNGGDTLILMSGAVGGLPAWWAIGGSVQLPYAGVFAAAAWATQSAGDNSNKLATTAYVDRGTSGASQVLLGTATASGSSSIQFTSIPAGYDEYVVVMTNVVPVTNAAVLELSYSVNNGSSYIAANYVYDYGVVAGGSSSATGSSSSASIQMITVGNTANDGISGELRLFGLGTAAAYKQSTFVLFGTNGTSYTINTGGGGNTGTTATTTAVNAISIAFSTGNISTGRFALYGIRKA